MFKIYFLFLALIATYGLKHYRKLPVYGRKIVILVLIVLFFEFLGRVSIHLFRNSFPSYHALILFQFILYSQIYLSIYTFSNKIKKVVSIFAFLFSISTVLISVFIQNLFVFPTYAFSLISFFIVLCSILGLSNMLNFPAQTPLYKQAVFWFTIGSLLFYAITFFTFGFFNPIIRILKIIPEWQNVFIWIMNLVLYGSYFLTLRLSLKSNHAE